VSGGVGEACPAGLGDRVEIWSQRPAAIPEGAFCESLANILYAGKGLFVIFSAIAMLRAGIVGLPNVGKSTLFNAVVANAKAQAANFPFCTIEPNVGVVAVPDPRLDVLAKISESAEIIPARVEFVDIAGLVEGASKGRDSVTSFSPIFARWMRSCMLFAASKTTTSSTSLARLIRLAMPKSLI
jgi:hypothetical protein